MGHTTAIGFAKYTPGQLIIFTRHKLILAQRLCQGPMVAIFVGEDKILFNLPKNILCKHSMFFQKALDGQFKEALDRRMDLPEDDPTAFAYLIQWFYQGKVDVLHDCLTLRDKNRDLPIEREACRILFRLHHLSDKLLIKPPLHKGVLMELRVAFEQLQSKGLPVITPDLVIDVYQNTIERAALRKLVAQEVGKDFACWGYLDFQRSFEECPGFAVDLIMISRSAQIKDEEELGECS